MLHCPFCQRSIAPGSATCPHCAAPLTGLVPPAAGVLETRVRGLLAEGQKLAAVKLYKDETGVSLLEAKTAVETWEAGEPLATQDPSSAADWESDVLRLLHENKKIQAIKLYKERVGCGLKEAKQAVELLGKRQGASLPGGGCFGMALLAIACLSLIASYLA